MSRHTPAVRSAGKPSILGGRPVNQQVVDEGLEQSHSASLFDLSADNTCSQPSGADAGYFMIDSIHWLSVT